MSRLCDWPMAEGDLDACGVCSSCFLFLQATLLFSDSPSESCPSPTVISPRSQAHPLKLSELFASLVGNGYRPDPCHAAVKSSFRPGPLAMGGNVCPVLPQAQDEAGVPYFVPHWCSDVPQIHAPKNTGTHNHHCCDLGDVNKRVKGKLGSGLLGILRGVSDSFWLTSRVWKCLNHNQNPPRRTCSAGLSRSPVIIPVSIALHWDCRRVRAILKVK